MAARLLRAPLSYRLSIAARIAAAVLGGYALANTLPVAVASALTTARGEATLIALQGSFVVYTASVMWAFAARSARVAWLGLMVPAVLSVSVAWFLR